VADRYGTDVLANNPHGKPRSTEQSVELGMVVEDAQTGYVGAVVRIEYGRMELEDRHGRSVRQAWYLDAMRTHGLPARVVGSVQSIDGGRQAMAAILAADPELDAIFTYNDVIAIGGQTKLIAQPHDEFRGRLVLCFGRDQPAGIGNVLDANAVGIRLARVKSDVVIANHLHDFAILADDVVRAHVNRLAVLVGALVRALEIANRVCDLVTTIVGVDDDVVDGACAADRLVVGTVRLRKATGAGVFGQNRVERANALFTVHLGPEQVVAAITADFADKTVSGDGGCNSFSGPYRAERRSIKLGPLRSTLKACADHPSRQLKQQWPFHEPRPEMAERLEIARPILLGDARGQQGYRLFGRHFIHPNSFGIHDEVRPTGRN